MKAIVRVLCLAALGFIVGCSPLRVLNELIPSGGFRERSDLPYGSLPRQTLDVYVPEGVRGPAPVVVFFYGGRWQEGSRELYRFVGDALTSRGFVAVIPDYRVYPQVEFPEFVRDGALAVRWAKRNAHRFGGDPERVFVMGHSAGAHIAGLLATDERYLREAGLEGNALAGMIGIAGPYDFLPFEDADVRALMGPPEGWPATQPVRFVDGDEPPMLLLQGGGDETVKPRNATRLAERVREEGGCAKVIVYPGVGHIEIVVALFRPFRGLAPVLDDAAEWIRSLSTPSPPCA